MSKIVTLNDLGYVNRGRSKHRPRNAPELYGGPYPFVQTADIKHADLYLTKYGQTYSELGLAQSRLWPAGTLCVTIAANIADTAILGCEACFPDSIIGFIPDEDKCDVRYVKYLFDTELQESFQQLSQGVAQDNLSKDKLLSVKFHIPDLPIQRRIADILSAYDDLIENNRRRIALMEEGARELYKEWFVSLRFPGRERLRVADGLPKGWHKVKLGNCIDTNRESYRASELPETINYIDIASVKEGRIFDKRFMSSHEAPGRARRRVKAGDVIWSNVRPNLKSYALVLENEPNDVYSTGFTVLTPVSIPYSFLYLHVSTDEFVAYLGNMVTGATYPAVRPCDFEQAQMILPDSETLARFHALTSPLFHQCSILARKSAALAAARDMLLPRLMKGEVNL